MKPIRTTTPAIAASCCYAPVRLISTHLNRSSNPFLFQFFFGWAKIILFDYQQVTAILKKYLKKHFVIQKE